jgi:hypothetical protein
MENLLLCLEANSCIDPSPVGCRRERLLVVHRSSLSVEGRMCLLPVGVALGEAILHEPSDDDDRDAGEGGRDESGVEEPAELSLASARAPGRRADGGFAAHGDPSGRVSRYA